MTPLLVLPKNLHYPYFAPSKLSTMNRFITFGGQELERAKEEMARERKEWELEKVDLSSFLSLSSLLAFFCPPY